MNVWIICFLFLFFNIVYNNNLFWHLSPPFRVAVTDGTRQSVTYTFDHKYFDFALASHWLENHAKLLIPHKPYEIERPLILRFKSYTPFVNASIDYLHNISKDWDKLSFNVCIIVSMRHILQNKHQYGNYFNFPTFTFHKQRSLYENASQMKKCISYSKKNGLQNNLQRAYNWAISDVMINTWGFKNSKLEIVPSESSIYSKQYVKLCEYNGKWYAFKNYL